MNIIFAGGGTDAGGLIWTGHGFKRVPGWNPEAIAELVAAISVIRDSKNLKTPGLAEATTKSVAEFVQKELGTHFKEGGVLVIGA
jgi:hypothetical protein